MEKVFNSIANLVAVLIFGRPMAICDVTQMTLALRFSSDVNCQPTGAAFAANSIYLNNFHTFSLINVFSLIGEKEKV